MKLVDKYSWIERLWQRVGNVLLMISLLFAVTAVEAGTLKTSIEGCRAGSSNGYTLTTQPPIVPGGDPIPMYVCNNGAYTTGNLFTWAELDMVPHRFIVSNGTAVAQNFTFSVGGDYQDANEENLTGWDYITPLTLDPVLSDPVCFDIQDASIQNLVITPDNQTIYRTVSVVGLPAGATCVANYNMRLSIGSSGYPGSSLQDFLLDGGKQTLPLPAVTATTFSKTMTAVRAGIRNWTVTKSSNQGSLLFEDTCAVDAVLEKDVNITVSWTKGEVTAAGMVNVSTVISASNTASRDINISVVDTLYSGTTVLGARNCGPTVLTSNTIDQTVCSNTFIIDAAAAVDLNDKAVATYTDPDFLENPILTIKEATASATVQGSGSNTYDTVIVKDGEWISGNGLSYSADSFSPAIGAFVGYVAGAETTGDVNWTSNVQEGNGTVTFSKKVYIEPATVTTGTLSDRASLMGSDGFVVIDKSFGINLSSSALVQLTIIKTIDVSVPLVADTNFTFSVRNEAGDDQNVTIPFSAGETSNSITIEGMDPGLYEVTELPTPGYEAAGTSSRVVDLNLPTCAASVTFNNIAAGRPSVQVAKITDPAMLDGADQAVGWTMTLYYQAAEGGEWVEINSTVTTAGGKFELLRAEDTLQTGNYKIEETPPSGEEGKWYLAGLSDECQFSYNIEDENRSDYECIFYNKKYATVIIKKELEPSYPGFNADADFSFAQDINSSVPLVLGDGESETYLNLESGIYEVTENDPRPDFDLSALTCAEYYDTVGTTAVVNSVTDVRLRKATINLDPGETVECTFTNRERGRLDMIKLEDGVENISQFWKFTLEGPDGIMERNTSTSLNFEDARLIPGETYRLCEIDVNIAWDAVWTLEGTEVNTTSEVLDNTRDTCYEFSVSAGEEANFVIDNISPPAALHLGNYVWYDDNNNGIQDAGEEPVEGFTVELLDENGVLVKDLYNEDTHITDADGHYDFYVEEGNYSIRFSGLPANYVFAKTKVGTDDSIDSDANSNGVTAVVSVSGADNFDLDAGIYCICNEISSSSSPAMNQISAALMILMTMMLGLFFVRRENQLKKNER